MFLGVKGTILRSLTKDKVIWPEDLSKGARADGVHGARLQVHQDGTRDILIAC